MSLVTDSPIHSSSNSDFAAILDAELDSDSDTSVDQEDEDDYDSAFERCKVEVLESTEDPQDSTSHGDPKQSLDLTLLNSTRFLDVRPEEEYLKSQTDSLQDVSKGSLFRLDSMHMLTKLRPFVHTFLKEASKFFEITSIGKAQGEFDTDGKISFLCFELSAIWLQL
ncbi:hypothetical protein F0562_009302 [Nyssa sinensis]|uniref:protein-serine/threonine phosphatase n=1 Tax=Nyssa sinensis TaxID=561372 RepID=A0A5J4ZXT2_9ASTE|nr:hypothetical protein F0562_009302 [Nyssa sinensis]